MSSGARSSKETSKRRGESSESTSKSSKRRGSSTESLLGEKIGTDAIAKMKGQVREWTGLIQERCDHLGSYVDTLEKLNARLEARTDRSLVLAEVSVYLFVQPRHPRT